MGVPREGLEGTIILTRREECVYLILFCIEPDNLMDKSVEHRTNSSVAIFIQERTFESIRIQGVQETIS